MNTPFPSLLELISLLLPGAPNLCCNALDFDLFDSSITFDVTSTQTTSCCPRCQQPAARVHSRYVRTLTDLPWADAAVRLHLHVRRFFCGSDSCPQRIFTERVPAIVTPWARRTQRLAHRHRAVGLALGGAAGTRLATTFDHPTSRHTILRLVRQLPELDEATPSQLGVDDFALRKGQRYGTILVNLASGRPIELLPERTADVLTTWLAAHPGVELITRDRTGAYAEGASDGAPAAVQVADRWHILSNLATALKQVFADHPVTLTPTPAPEGKTAEAEQGEPTSPPVPLTRTEHVRHQRQQRRHTRYAQIQTLAAQGASLHSIARELRLSRTTVRTYARAATTPLPQPRAKRISLLDLYKPYLLERWNAGCHVGTDLWREITAQGYRGGRSIAMDFVAAIRKQQGIAPMKRTGLPAQAATDPRTRPPTPRELTWLVLKRPAQRDELEQAQLLQVQQATPALELAVTLAQEFATMLRERGHAHLDGWLARAETSGLAPLKSFAGGIRRDYGAVKAALSLPYSNGVVEGNVNRLKNVKRQMYGRANVDLLRKRALYAA